MLRWPITTVSVGVELASELDKTLLSDQRRQQVVTGPLTASFTSTPPARLPADTTPPS
jgi:hypothetical protein